MSDGGADPRGSAPDTRSSGASEGLDPRGTVAVVTGGAGGIGVALARGLAARGASTVVVVDLQPARVSAVAETLDAESRTGRVRGMALDVTDREATEALVDVIEAEHGHIDLFCANAGIGTAGGVDTAPEQWQSIWEVNVMAHVHAAAVMVPRWVHRGRGYLLSTASAAGLLTNLGDAPYSVTKHGAVAFAEWVAITHGGAGVGVTCLCPQGVRTPLLFGSDADEFATVGAGSGPSSGDRPADVDIEGSLAGRTVRSQRILEPDEVASAALDAVAEGRFLALPHEEVASFEQVRTSDHDRWIASMRRLQAHITGSDAG